MGAYPGWTRGRGSAKKVGRMLAVKGWEMEKKLCWAGIGVAGFLLLLFLLDVILEIPFGGISTAVDIIGIICCAILGYASWDTLREIS